MKYRSDRYGKQISQLGYGCMRFTRKGSGIDYEKAEKEVLLGIERGINYYDTAYIYPGSEAALGEIVADDDEHQPDEYERDLRYVDIEARGFCVDRSQDD